MPNRLSGRRPSDTPRHAHQSVLGSPHEHRPIHNDREFEGAGEVHTVELQRRPKCDAVHLVRNKAIPVAQAGHVRADRQRARLLEVPPVVRPIRRVIGLPHSRFADIAVGSESPICPTMWDGYRNAAAGGEGRSERPARRTTRPECVAQVPPLRFRQPFRYNSNLIGNGAISDQHYQRAADARGEIYGRCANLCAQEDATDEVVLDDRYTPRSRYSKIDVLAALDPARCSLTAALEGERILENCQTDVR